MRWFKHMTCSFNDEKLSAVVDELGMEGYGFWWRILEVVAEKMDENGEYSVSFSPKKWGNFFGFSAKKFENFVRIFQKNTVFDVEFSENQVTVSIPNLLKYRDEWSRKKARNSGVAPEKLRPSRARLKDPDKDKEYSTPPVSPPEGEDSPAKKKGKAASSPKSAYGEHHHVKLTAEELARLRERYGDEDTRAAIRKLDLHIEAKGRDIYKSHYAALQNWVFQAVEEDRARLARASPLIREAGNLPRTMTQAQKTAQERERRSLWLLEQRRREREAEHEVRHAGEEAQSATDVAIAHGACGALPVGGL